MSEATKKLAAQDMSTQICEAVIKAFKGLSKTWKESSEADQRFAINSIDMTIKQAISKAVETIAADKRAVVQCTVDQVVFKDGVKIVLKSAGTASTHELADATGQKVLVVITAEEKFKGAAPKPEKDQKPLFDGTKTAAAGGGDSAVKKNPRTKRSGKK